MNINGFIARRYLFSRKHISLISTLTFISIAGVTIGTALLIVVLSVFNGFFDVIKSFLLSHDPDVRIEASGKALFKYNEELQQTLNGIEEIKVISPFIEGKALMAIEGMQNEVVDVKGINKELYFQLNDIEHSITAGIFDVSVRNRKPGIIIHQDLKNNLRLNLGEEVALLSASSMKNALTQITVPQTFRYEVRGSYFLQQVAEGPKVFVDKEAAERLFQTRGSISGIDLKLLDNDDAFDVQKQLQSQLGDDYRISSWYDLQKPLYDVMNLEKWASFIILILIVIVAVLNIVGSLTMIVIQKKRDIGILISMGYSRAGIRSIFRKQGVLIGLLGCGLGGALGLFLCWLQAKYGVVALSSAFIINAYPVLVRPVDVIIILASSLLLCILASWYPANRAANIQPAEVVRYE